MDTPGEDSDKRKIWESLFKELDGQGEFKLRQNLHKMPGVPYSRDMLAMQAHCKKIFKELLCSDGPKARSVLFQGVREIKKHRECSSRQAPAARAHPVRTNRMRGRGTCCTFIRGPDVNLLEEVGVVF